MPEAMLTDVAELGTAGATRTATIAGLGTALPANKVGSEEIASRVGVDPAWIEQRTGVVERHHAVAGESLASLAAQAGSRALAAAGLDPAQLDAVLVATFTPDRLLPHAAPLVAEEIGASGAFACDLGAACTGFLSGLALGTAQIEAGRAERVLVVGADLVSRVTDHEDRKTAGLFADGAGAAVLAPGIGSETGRIGEIVLHSDATGADCISVTHDERLVRMRGQDTFRAAVEHLSAVTREALGAEQARVEDVDLFVYHQANARITQAVGERLGLPPERVVDCIARLGNTSAATLPLALARAADEGRLRPGSRVLLAAFGSGFVWGGGLITWNGAVGR